ncbi:MAG: PIN domain-containing protein [Spirochaetota bacterium]
MAKEFLDTNIIVYANDAAHAAKQERAIEVVTALMTSGDGVISTQVLMEYAAVATRKLGQPQSTVFRQLELLERFEVVQVTGALIRAGIAHAETFGVSTWDGTIVAAALAARCTCLVSEDLTAGRSYGGIVVRNPFEDLATD